MITILSVINNATTPPAASLCGGGLLINEKRNNMREIKTLTPKEGAELWNLVMPKQYTPFRGRAYRHEETEELPERYIFASGVERLCVRFDGEVWSDSDLMRLELNKEKIYSFFKEKGFK